MNVYESKWKMVKGLKQRLLLIPFDNEPVNKKFYSVEGSRLQRSGGEFGKHGKWHEIWM